MKRAAVAPTRPVVRALHYKVVELSNVDEHALERTVNEWVSRGWTFDGVQFAMRESSKRPSMGFVFFTREGPPLEEQAPEPQAGFRDAGEAEQHLARLSTAHEPVQLTTTTTFDAWERLKELAGDDGGEA